MFSQFVVILHRPRDVRNIGAVVRAMKNMGFSQLRLVAPTPFELADIGGIAHRSEDLLSQLTIFDSLDAALAGLSYVVGTTARHHERQVRQDVRVVTGELAGRAVGGATVGLLFGPEDNGLDNAALDRCQLLLSLPCDPTYPSLNLAQAALLLLYELRAALAEPPAPPARPDLAGADDLETCLSAWQAMLAAVKFVKSGSSARPMRSLREIIFRSAPSQQEAALLTAIAREVVSYIGRARRG
jgi:tRNA/rRNA methyltransferase